MALFIEADVRARAETELARSMTKDARQLIIESTKTYRQSRSYDIFLSHSSRDAQLILGIKKIFEDLRYTVYVDWVDDLQLNRNSISSSTAEILRQRMKSSKSLSM